MKMKLLLLGLLSLVLTFSNFTLGYGATTGGSSCTKQGQVVVSNGQKLTCSMIWVATRVASINKPKASTAASSGIARSKGFELISVQFSDTYGSPQATARVQNVTNMRLTATFDITIFASDGLTPSITLAGVANEVSPGETQTVSFISAGGTMPSGKFKYAFQTSAQF